MFAVQENRNKIKRKRTTPLALLRFKPTMSEKASCDAPPKLSKNPAENAERDLSCVANSHPVKSPPHCTANAAKAQS